MLSFYDYSKTYLELQTAMYFPGVDISIESYFQPELYSGCWSAATKGSETSSDMMRMLAMVLQNRRHLPNEIGFIKNLSTFKKVLHNFDVEYISNSVPANLLNDFIHEGIVSSVNRDWCNYCIGLVDAAYYLVTHFTTFPSYCMEAQFNPDRTIKELSSIKGIGEALARNFLKEIGVDTCKPDSHLKDIFGACEGLDSKSIPNSLCVSLLHQKAAAANVSDYQLDKILWLICSGNYYHQGLKISKGKKQLKKRFIDGLLEAIKNRVVDY